MIFSYLIIALYLMSIMLSVLSLVSEQWGTLAVSLVGVCAGSWLIFSNTLNAVQAVGRVYWIVRNNAKKGDRIVSTGFMRQIDEPWLIGKGIQMRAGRFSLQVGICYANAFDSEDDGVLNALQGRYMDDAPVQIRDWR